MFLLTPFYTDPSQDPRLPWLLGQLRARGASVSRQSCVTQAGVQGLSSEDGSLRDAGLQVLQIWRPLSTVRGGVGGGFLRKRSAPDSGAQNTNEPSQNELLNPGRRAAWMGADGIPFVPRNASLMWQF